jgi:hypothetical protein
MCEHAITVKAADRNQSTKTRLGSKSGKVKDVATN